MDEFLYQLYPEEVKTHIPIIEELMLNGMRRAIPDVKIGVESSLMTHWDKGAKEISKIEWDDNGLPILELPPLVKEVYDKRNAQTK